MFNITRFMKICDHEEQLFNAMNEDGSKIKHAYDRGQIQKAIAKFTESNVGLDEIYFNGSNWNDPMLWLIRDFFWYVLNNGEWIKESIVGSYEKIETKNYIYAAQRIEDESHFFIRNKTDQVTHYFGWYKDHGNTSSGKTEVTDENNLLTCFECLKIIEDIIEYTETLEEPISPINQTLLIKL